jgi:hypothetical protein
MSRRSRSSPPARQRACRGSTHVSLPTRWQHDIACPPVLRITTLLGSRNMSLQGSRSQDKSTVSCAIPRSRRAAPSGLDASAAASSAGDHRSDLPGHWTQARAEPTVLREGPKWLITEFSGSPRWSPSSRPAIPGADGLGSHETGGDRSGRIRTKDRRFGPEQLWAGARADDHFYAPSPGGGTPAGLGEMGWARYRGLRPRPCWHAPLGLGATGRAPTTYARNAGHATRARRHGLWERTSPSPHLRHGIHPRDPVKDLCGKQAATELEATDYAEKGRVRMVAHSHGTIRDTTFRV